MRAAAIASGNLSASAVGRRKGIEVDRVPAAGHLHRPLGQLHRLHAIVVGRFGARGQRMGGLHWIRGIAL